MVTKKLLRMKMLILISLISSSCKVSTNASVSAIKEEGFTAIFNGRTLDGWEGDSTYWRAEDGKIVGEVTPQTILKSNVFLIWRKGTVKDFELKVDYRVSAKGNSGINYRSEEVKGLPYLALKGYQADIDGEKSWAGMNYEERRRTTIASRGEKVLLPTLDLNGGLEKFIEENRWLPRHVTGSLGNTDSLATHITDDWNAYHLVVKGNRLQHYINGVLMSDVVDEDASNRRFEGLLGVQVHIGPPMKIEYRNFRIKHLN